MGRKLRGLAPEHLEGLSTPCVGCLFWETGRPLERRCGAVCDAEEWSAWWRAVADEWGSPGRVALEDDVVLGFVKYAPARFFPQAFTFAASPPDPDAVLISCLHIREDTRHRGLGKVLMQAGLKDLVQRGVRRVEAFGAVVASNPVEQMPMLTVEFLEREGFAVAAPDTQYPLMRIDMRSLADITENIEALLESLRFPLRAPQQAPSSWMRSARG